MGRDRDFWKPLLMCFLAGRCQSLHILPSIPTPLTWPFPEKSCTATTPTQSVSHKHFKVPSVHDWPCDYSTVTPLNAPHHHHSHHHHHPGGSVHWWERNLWADLRLPFSSSYNMAVTSLFSHLHFCSVGSAFCYLTAVYFTNQAARSAIKGSSNRYVRNQSTWCLSLDCGITLIMLAFPVWGLTVLTWDSLAVCTSFFAAWCLLFCPWAGLCI